MKKVLLITMSVVLVLTLGACSAIRNKIINTIKSAVANETLFPEVTGAFIFDTAEPEETDEPFFTDEPEITEDSLQTEAPPQDDDGISGFWPEGIPTWIPAFQYGLFKDDDFYKWESDGTATYSMSFTDVAKDQVEEYADSIKTAGFETYIVESDGQLYVSGTMKKGEADISTIVLTFETDSGVLYYMLMYSDS